MCVPVAPFENYLKTLCNKPNWKPPRKERDRECENTKSHAAQYLRLELHNILQGLKNEKRIQTSHNPQLCPSSLENDRSLPTFRVTSLPSRIRSVAFCNKTMASLLHFTDSRSRFYFWGPIAVKSCSALSTPVSQLQRQCNYSCPTRAARRIAFYFTFVSYLPFHMQYSEMRVEVVF